MCNNFIKNVIQKSINLISRAAFDADSSGIIDGWMTYDDGYVVANEHIANTILDGSDDSNGSGLESVITINSPPGSECITPIIKGFTITGGGGTKVQTGVDETGNPINEVKGGGYRSLVNIGENGGQEVPHLHFHIFGGEKVGKMVS